MYRPWCSPRRSSIVCTRTSRRDRRRTKHRRCSRRGFHNNRKKRRPSLFRPKAVISHYNLITICILITILFHTVRKRIAFKILQMIRIDNYIIPRQWLVPIKDAIAFSWTGGHYNLLSPPPPVIQKPINTDKTRRQFRTVPLVLLCFRGARILGHCE